MKHIPREFVGGPWDGKMVSIQADRVRYGVEVANVPKMLRQPVSDQIIEPQPCRTIWYHLQPDGTMQCELSQVDYTLEMAKLDGHVEFETSDGRVFGVAYDP